VKSLLRTLSLILTLLIASASFAASPVKARPLAGIGIILIKESPSGNGATLRLYREPKLGRIDEVKAESLPQLTTWLAAGDGRKVAVVTAKRLGWYKIVYDDGEREGWVEGGPSVRFFKWGEFLPGKGATLLTGLRKEFYQLRREPSQNSDPLELLARGSGVYCLELEGEWLKVLAKGDMTGWIRWRDENSRFLLSVSF
jgi:hypothetical protein